MHNYVRTVNLLNKFSGLEDISYQPIDSTIFWKVVFDAFSDCQIEYLLRQETVAACWTNLEAK